MSVTWARLWPGSRHRGEGVVVVDSDLDQQVIRKNQPLRAAPSATRVEIDFAIDPARPGRQPLAEIVERVAANDMAGPHRAQPATMPAMRRRRVLGHIARRQMPGDAKALHRFDKTGDVAQPGFLRKGGERLWVGP